MGILENTRKAASLNPVFSIIALHTSKIENPSGHHWSDYQGISYWPN